MDEGEGQHAAPVVVIGAGIVGVSAAIWLQRARHQVILVDRAGPGEGASHGNGGVLASCSIVPVTVPGLLRKAPLMLLDSRQPLFLKWSYLPRLAPWLRAYLRHCRPQEARRIAAALLPLVVDSLDAHQALSAGTGAEKWVVPSDYLFLYRDRAHFEADAFGWAVRKEHGFRWDEFEGAALRDYDPSFAPALGFGVRLGGHGRIADPGRYVKDLAAHFVGGGGRLIRGEVTDIVSRDGRVAGVRIGGETLPCSAAVLAAGVWSGALSRRLGLAIPLESERGYSVELWNPSRMPRSPVMIASGRYVATPMDGRLRLAGIVEFGGLDAPASRAPFALLVNGVRAAMPDLTWEETSEWMGHRPATVDSLPVIGEVPGVKRAFLGFGHHHVGLTAGPATGRILAGLVSGAVPNLDLAPYAPSRFQ